MKKTLLSIAFGMATLCAMPVSAQDVYVYNGTDATAVATAANVRKIAFTNDGMTITSASGQTTTVALADFDRFTFHKVTPTGVQTLNVAGLTVKFDKQVLRVSSDKALTKVQIYAANGTLVDQVAVKANQAVRNISSLPAGTYILKMDVAGKTYSKKFVK